MGSQFDLAFDKYVKFYFCINMWIFCLKNEKN